MRTRSYSDDRCQVLAGSPRPGVLCSLVTGFATVKGVEFMMRAFEEVDAESPGEKVEAFHDWEAVRGYEPGARERYTEWSKQHRERVKKIHVLVTSRMVVMAISVARLALPYLVGYHSRAEFEKARSERIGHAAVFPPG